MNTNIVHINAVRLWRCVPILCCFWLGAFSLHGQSVKISWPANPETDIAGYMIYIGTTAGNYTTSVNVGNVTNCTVTNLAEGVTYYLAVSAFNSAGVESIVTNNNLSFRLNARPEVAGPVTVTAVKSTAAAIPGLVVSDADAVGNMTLTLSVTRGTLNVLTTVAGGLTASQISGNGSGNISITAPLAAINATLSRSNGVTYTGRLNLVGSDTLITSVNDNDTAGLGGPRSNTRLVSLNVVGDALDNWRNTYFQASDLTDASKEAAVWGDLADPDQDGRQNLMEFALGLNPLSREGGSAGLVSDLADIDGKKYLTLSFRQLSNAAFLQYVTQVSGDKQTWVSGAGDVQLLTATTLDSQTQLVTYQDLTPVDAQIPRFIRLKVIRN